MLKKVPDVFVIVFSLILFAAALTWILPGGSYERAEKSIDGKTRQVLIEGSYQEEPAAPQALSVVTAPLEGFLKLADIIVFIFIVGGAFFILNETGAIAAGTHKLVELLAGREFLIIPIVMLFFSFFGAVFGMCEEAMPFALIFVPLAPAALIVGFAGGIIIILERGNIMDTILYGMSSLTSQMPSVLAAEMMYVVQMGLNFFIPSGSTKAALTMPLFAPLADLSGITRQTAVLAYQLGDGFTNMIIPTSGVTVGTLAMAKIPFEKWFRWNLPMQIAFFFMALAILVWPAMTGWT